MKFENSLKSIQANGFDWALFREYFPFGDISLREGNYEKLVTAALDALSHHDERSQLIQVLLNHVFALIALCFHIFIRAT